MTVKLKGIVLPPALNYPKLDDFKLFDIMAQVPVTAGLVGSYFLGSRNADPTYNFANPSLPLIQHLSPDYSDSKCTVLSVNRGYFDTQIVPSTSQTIVAIAKVPSATGVIASNYFKDSVGSISGDSLMEIISTVKQLRYYAQTGASSITSVTRDISAFNTGDFGVLGGIISSTPAVGAWSMSESLPPDATIATLPARAINSRTLRIGASYDTSEFINDIGISAVLIYNNDIGRTNITTVMNWLRNVVGVEAGIWSAPKSS
ncbi:hypothetical protein [Klebsiella pneumoniae]|uniref:hypothetical protein n=1 Tax=Klebsiella pneumoniae TaxID=573 RepID=UPI001083D885|nr:hypothetical protein [Klebsiella pneumoniae]EIY5372237.1 hypothetical protein [Klebsiella variicola]VGF14299.1 Uncharacterised protein [Klebsiella pneumoniae]HDK6114819.1 hypothetical protein [Klebsiella variicola]